MKRDEVRSIIGDITDEQLDAIMKLSGAAVNAEKAKAAELQKRLDEASDSLRAANEEKAESAKAAMTLEDRIKAMEDTYAARTRELSVERNKLEAQKIFTSAGLTEEDYAPLIGAVVTDDAKYTEATAKAIAALVSAQRTAAVQSARQELLASTPKPNGGSGSSGTVTKEQFDAMSYSELVKLAEESPETYKELSNS